MWHLPLLHPSLPFSFLNFKVAHMNYSSVLTKLWFHLDISRHTECSLIVFTLPLPPPPLSSVDHIPSHLWALIFFPADVFSARTECPRGGLSPTLGEVRCLVASSLRNLFFSLYAHNTTVIKYLCYLLFNVCLPPTE